MRASVAAVIRYDRFHCGPALSLKHASGSNPPDFDWDPPPGWETMAGQRGTRATLREDGFRATLRGG